MIVYAPPKTPPYERIIYSLHPCLGILGKIQSRIKEGKTAHLAKYHMQIGFGYDYNFIPRTINDIQNQDPGENHWNKRNEIIASLKEIGEVFCTIHKISESDSVTHEIFQEKAQEIIHYLEILQMRCNY